MDTSKLREGGMRKGMLNTIHAHLGKGKSFLNTLDTNKQAATRLYEVSNQGQAATYVALRTGKSMTVGFIAEVVNTLQRFNNALISFVGSDASNKEAILNSLIAKALGQELGNSELEVALVKCIALSSSEEHLPYLINCLEDAKDFIK